MRTRHCTVCGSFLGGGGGGGVCIQGLHGLFSENTSTCQHHWCVC